MANKVPDGSNFNTSMQFFKTQELKGKETQEVRTTSLGKEGKVTTGEKLPGISGEVSSVTTENPRETHLGEMPPPLSSQETIPMTGKKLTSSEEMTSPEHTTPEIVTDERETETKSVVKTEQTTTQEVQSTAQETGTVAFNALEKFVSIFSKTQAGKMQSKRVDTIVHKAMQHIRNGEVEKAGIALANLAEISPSKFQKVLKEIKSGATQGLQVIDQEGNRVIDNYTKVANAAFDETMKKMESYVKKGKMEKAGTALATLATISPARFNSIELDKLPPQVLTIALKKFPVKEFPELNSRIAFNLGKAVLTPVSTTDPVHENIKSVMRFIEDKSRKKPGHCGADLWRTMTRMKFFDSKSERPVIDGSKISKEPPAKDKESSMQMKEALNLFFKHATGGKELIPESMQGQNQEDATLLGEALGLVFEALRSDPPIPLEDLLKKIDEQHLEAIFNQNDDSKFAEMDKKNERFKELVDHLFLSLEFLEDGERNAMQAMFGLGAQELFTRPGDWTIPKEMRLGDGELQIAEFSGAYVKQLEPFEHGRFISITTNENGNVEYRLTQPVTFKDQQNQEPIGTCNIETVMVFNKDMQCVSFSQEVQPPKLKEA